MKPLVILDAAAVLGGNRLFARGAITALVRLKDFAHLSLVGSSDDDRWPEVEAILSGEDIEFVSLAEFATADRTQYLVSSRDPSDFANEAIGNPSETLDPIEIGWNEVARKILYPSRVAAVERRTSETAISVRVDLDGHGSSDIDTGLGFFDHMLDQVAWHSGADISISVSGDLHVDEHHTIEDTAIALGEAFGTAIGDKRGIERYAFVLPMDDSLAQVAFDWSGRSWLVWNAEFLREKVGDMPTEMFHHFFKSFADAARCNMNITVGGDNEHHMIESVFKAFGRCLRQASARRPADERVPSTKGVL